jgi:hypothetical protein
MKSNLKAVSRLLPRSRDSAMLACAGMAKTESPVTWCWILTSHYVATGWPERRSKNATKNVEDNTK